MKNLKYVLRSETIVKFLLSAFFVAAVLAAIIHSARAEDARKINFTTVLVDQDDHAFLECTDNPPPKSDQDCKSRQPVTLGMISMRALVVPEANLAPEESLRRGHLALATYKAEDAVLTVEEISLIKKQISKQYSPLIVVRSFAILDPAAK